MPLLNYTSEDLTDPVGSNNLSPEALYFQRSLYRERIYPGHLFSPLDTWYEKQFFGRVDRRQNTIVPRREQLVTIRSAAQTMLLTFNFVAAAFEDFVAQMQHAKILGILHPGTPTAPVNEKIFNMKAYKAYDDPTQIYQHYLQQLYDAYATNLTDDRHNKIVDFASFRDDYLIYLKQMCAQIPITKTNYLLTNVTSFMGTGLSIAIDAGPSDDDAYKYEKYINDPNFTFYARSAKKFGFSVNKNIPWVLTADLFSDPIIRYIHRFPEDGPQAREETFFKIFYTRTFLSDVDDLRTFIMNSYKALHQDVPLYEEKTFAPGCSTWRVDNKLRAPLPSNAEDFLSDKRMADLYWYLRSTEAQGPPVPPPRIAATLEMRYQHPSVASWTPLQNVQGQINQIYRKYIYSNSYPLLRPRWWTGENRR